jgi:hypothetical protein
MQQRHILKYYEKAGIYIAAASRKLASKQNYCGFIYSIFKIEKPFLEPRNEKFYLCKTRTVQHFQ